MKILYIKNNSERNPAFQLKTILFEKNGQKYVKKEILNAEALPHLQKMKTNYQRLSDSVKNNHIKFAPIVEEDETSLTFAFIEGISLEEKFHEALKKNKEDAQKVIDSYIELIRTSFITNTFNPDTMINDTFTSQFGDDDFSSFKGLSCFDGISNIDLILSNIIFKDEEIYIIDYEWSSDISVPVDYVIYRTMELIKYHTKGEFGDFKSKYNTQFFRMERHFVENYVMNESFYHTKKRYLKHNNLVLTQLNQAQQKYQALKMDNQQYENQILKHLKAQEEQTNQIIARDKIIESHALENDKYKNEILKHIEAQNEQRNEIIARDKIIASHTSEQDKLRQRIEKQKEELLRKDNALREFGQDLVYARNIVNLRDSQLQFQNNHIAFLQDLTLKKRIKQKIKRWVPNKILNALGFQSYQEIGFDTAAFPSEVEIETAQTIEQMPDGHTYIYKRPELTLEIQEELEKFSYQPLISIVMPVYNIDPKWLDIAIHTIKEQWYENWELCIADDKSTNPKTIEYLQQIDDDRIKISYLEHNLNISGATNAAIALASGEYIALMDNDDEITPDALYEMVKAINEYGAEFIYSDEDLVTEAGLYTYPHFKPDFSPDLLMSHNYITHFSCFSKSLLDEAGYFDPEHDGAQDFELFLRLTEKTSKIYHIPKVLYHWRMLPSSTCVNTDVKPAALEAGRMALVKALHRRGLEGEVENTDTTHYFRVKYTIHDNPLVSIIIPFKDKPELLEMCITSVVEKSTYKNFEIIGISNNSESSETFEMMKNLEAKDARVKFYEYNVPFNYADINNYAVNTYAKGSHILLLNNDIEVIEPTWLEAMLEHSQREDIGCVGAKLYYPNDKIQHAGVIIGLGGYAGHSHKMFNRDDQGYFNRLNAIQDLAAVTAACLMIKKSIYDEVGGMDAVNFKVAYNDVDFCLRVLEKGYYNLFTPFAELYHHESISRGYEDTPEKIARFDQEKASLFQRHQKILEHGDPYYNPNLTLDREDFTYARHVC